MTIEQLIECIELSTRTKEVHVPSQDYYRRHGDSQEETITYVDAEYLLEELKKLQDAADYDGQNKDAYD